MRRARITISMLALATAGCGSARPADPVTPRSAGPAPALAPALPEQSSAQASLPAGACAGRSPDTRIAAQILDEGAALIFTTSDDIQNLRRRAADVTVPEPLLNASASSRLDNIQHGVRLIFEADPTTNPKQLQAQVVEHARQLAKRCGLVLEAPKDGTAAAVAARRAEQQRKQESASKSTPTSSKQSGAKIEVKPRQSETKKPPAQPPKADSKKPAPPKPAPADKPKPADKPRVEKDPSDGIKPPLPPLPGPRPDPILPKPD